MRFIVYLSIIFIMTIQLMTSCNSEAAEGDFLQSDTALFLGNSITFAGGYITYFDAFLRTQYPEKRITLVNRGMPSETVAGTSEKTHVPPRPYLMNRIDEVFSQVRPDFVFACYGMNDGIYQPFQAELFRQFREGVHMLEQKLREIDILDYAFLTPPPFEYPYFNHLPDTFSVFDYRNPSPDYNQTLQTYSDWMNQSIPDQTVQIHGPLQTILEEVHRVDSAFTLTLDGIHPNSTGHWLIADQIIQQLDLIQPSQQIVVVSESRSVALPLTEVKVSGRRIKIDVILNQVVPFDSAWSMNAIEESGYFERYNNVQVVVPDIQEGTYAAILAGDTLDIHSHEQLSQGVIINLLEAEHFRVHGQELLKLIQEKRALEKRLWVVSSEHYRFENMKKRLAEREILSQSRRDSLHSLIQILARPDTVSIIITPIQ